MQAKFHPKKRTYIIKSDTYDTIILKQELKLTNKRKDLIEKLDIYQ